MAVFVGGLSLVGLPPTIGFAARWALLSTVFRLDPITGLILLVASISPIVGLVQLMVRLFRRPRQLPGVEPQEEIGTPRVEREPLANVILLLVLAAATFVLGLFPQWIAGAADDLARYLVFFQ